MSESGDSPGPREFPPETGRSSGGGGFSETAGKYLSEGVKALPSPDKVVKGAMRTEGGIGVEKLQGEYGLSKGNAYIVDGILQWVGKDGLFALAKIIIGIILRGRGGGGS